MLLITILTKDFIKSTCKSKDSDTLNQILESIFFIHHYQQIIILEPGLKFEVYIEQLKHYENIKAQRTIEWEKVIKSLRLQKRLIDNLSEDIKNASKPCNFTPDSDFLTNSLANRVFSLSKNKYKSNHILFDIPNYGKTADHVLNGISKYFMRVKDNQFVKSEEFNLIQWEKLKRDHFYYYLAPFLVFFDTFIKNFFYIIFIT